MTALPEFVYLITVDGTWPVSAVADDHPVTAERVEAEVRRRTSGADTPRSTTHAHVWRVPVKDAAEMELVPASTIKPSLKERERGVNP